jgi:hypothetical protein
VVARLEWASVTGPLLVGVALILVALLVGRSAIARRREAARLAAHKHHEERQNDVHAWLVKDRIERVQRVMREGWGEGDPTATQVLHWLRTRKGARLHLIYTSTETGVEVRAEGNWVAGSPTVFRDHQTGNPEITWTLSGPARAIELPARTYHEVGAHEDRLVYRRGWAYWRRHEASEGLTSTHRRDEVEVWEEFTLSEPSTGSPGA